jgi:DNA invertase Pin-like site-specific DNA recombinase
LEADRLGRSVKQLVDLVGELHKQGAQFKSLTTPSTPERPLPVLLPRHGQPRRNGTRADRRAYPRRIDVARQLGRKGGRKPKMTGSKIESAKKLLASGVPPKDVAKNLGVSVPTLYRWVPASTHA